MRIGNAFSQILDPARQPLFDAAGCEAPLPDEGWPGMAPTPMRMILQHSVRMC